MVNKGRLCYSVLVKNQQKSELKKVSGIITLNSKAVGFLAQPELKEDIRIEADKLHTALHRDEVEVKIIGKMRGQSLGEVVSITKRNKDKFAGTIIRHENNKLYVTFKNNKTYEYSDVPYSVWKEFKASTSVGSYFSKNIKNKYPYTEIK